MPTDPCPYGEPEQGNLGRYPCLGGCGCWTLTPSTCLRCWQATRTYSPREVRMLPPEDPRRTRVRDPRDRTTPRRSVTR